MDTEKLRNLHKLKEDGVLSEEEYQAEKKKLLDDPRPTGSVLNATDSRDYSMFIHLSLLLGLVFPWIGLIVPIVLWLVKKEEPFIDQNGRIVANWLISSVIYSIVGLILAAVLVGFFILLALVICHVVFAIIGAMKAKEGVLWHYPLSIKFFKV
ncbi:DUF4870 domain-containing protein [Aliidiomarina haloalkalitolerans]|nr:DUF4870 domain-containing protein [Aliidiomarina haloalkalitolerans]